MKDTAFNTEYRMLSIESIQQVVTLLGRVLWNGMLTYSAS